MFARPQGATRGRIVLLGCRGFIGAALLERLRRQGHPAEGISSATLDLAAPDAAGRLADSVDEATTLIVTSRAAPGPDPLRTFADDMAIAMNLARCLALRRVRRFVYFSSTSVYGDGVTNLAITEDSPQAPTTLYGVAKAAAEGVLRHAARKAGVPLLVLRPCMIYGPGDRSTAYGPPGFLQSILREGKVRLFGDGSELRDHVYIDDVVEITAALALGGYDGAYNLVSGRSHSFQEVIACLRRFAPRAFEVVSVARDRPKTDQQFDPARLRAAAPGFRFTPLEEGLRLTCAAALAAAA
jgi:UDP-glucose 4-epimerase